MLEIPTFCLRYIGIYRCKLAVNGYNMHVCFYLISVVKLFIMQKNSFKYHLVYCIGHTPQGKLLLDLDNKVSN